MHKRPPKVDAGVSPPSKVPYATYACPNKCGYVEKGGKAPHYSECPQCHRPAGAFILEPAKAVKKGK